ncbi:MAG TPA: hypothetical protein VF037_01900 [Gemmatimonadales bacterium]
MVLQIFGEVHHRHPALAELALDAVAVGERGGEAVERQRGGDGDVSAGGEGSYF